MKLADLFKTFQRPPPPKTLQELYSAMSELVPVGVRSYFECSVTGEHYKEYAYGRKIHKVDRALSNDYQCHCKSSEPDLCAAHWNDFMDELEENPEVKLYWSIAPQYKEELFYYYRDQKHELTEAEKEDDGIMCHKMYLRYLLSDKPPEKERISSAPFPPPNSPMTMTRNKHVKTAWI